MFEEICDRVDHARIQKEPYIQEKEPCIRPFEDIRD